MKIGFLSALFFSIGRSVPVAENAEPYLGQFNGGVCAGMMLQLKF